MKRKYELPVLKVYSVIVDSHLLIGSHIGEGGAGQNGDVKKFVPFEDSENENIFEDNPFE